MKKVIYIITCVWAAVSCITASILGYDRFTDVAYNSIWEAISRTIPALALFLPAMVIGGLAFAFIFFYDEGM